MYSRLLIFLLYSLCMAQSDNINYIYYNGYFYDEAPSIVKVNIDSNEEVFSNQQFDLIYQSAFLFDVSNDLSKILLSPFNDGELIMDFSELGPLVLYDYISKDTLSSGALNARFTYNSDKIIFIVFKEMIRKQNKH